MATSTYFLFLVISAILAVTHATLLASPAVDAATGDHAFAWISNTSSPACLGSTAECLAGDFETLEMDSETNRRKLAAKKYISYGALSRNTVPCSRRGASYYNCRPGAQANPYSRGCSAITRCHR